MSLDTVAGLLEAVARLPEHVRAPARVRVAAALELPAPACRAALGLLALDLSAHVDQVDHGDRRDVPSGAPVAAVTRLSA